MLAQFVDEVERNSLPVIVIVPGAVIYELDGCVLISRVLYIHDPRRDRQKNRDGLAWFARRATSWLLQRIKERRSVKGQAHEETCKSTGNWKIREPGEVCLSPVSFSSCVKPLIRYRTPRCSMIVSSLTVACISVEAGKPFYAVPTITCA